MIATRRNHKDARRAERGRGTKNDNYMHEVSNSHKVKMTLLSQGMFPQIWGF